MTTMISEVYSAFRKAGVPEEEAQKAAEALTAESVATKADTPQVQQQLAVIKWMVGIVIAAQVLPLLKSIGVM